MSAVDPAQGAAQRGQITKQTILATALQLADEDGIGAVTIRRIADELGLSPMSLYRHIRTKEEIVEGLGDLAWEILGAEPDPGVEWDEHLRQTFMHIHRALLEHPGLVDILMLKPTRGMHVYAAIERMIGVLTGAGFSSDDALLAVASLESYTLGFTVQQRVRAGRDAGADHPPLFDLPADRFPNLSGDPSKFAGWANEERFVAGLDRAIESLRRDLQMAGQDEPRQERRT
jgi:TetR/AcrR family transcriptional regulator, tetracycline repressor protein